MNKIEKIVFFYILCLFFIYTIDITQLKLQYFYIYISLYIKTVILKIIFGRKYIFYRKLGISLHKILFHLPRSKRL